MDVKKLLLGTVAVGITWNVLDSVFHGVAMRSYYERLSGLFRSDMPMPLLVLGDFVAALVFVWVYDRVNASFAAGPKGGATYGLYAGVLVNFPIWIFMHMLLAGFPYGLSWVWTIYGIAAGVIGGAVVGATYKR